MKTCPGCGTQLAGNASACPKCGHKFTSWTVWAIAIFALLFFLTMFAQAC
jgi:uncharacterized membrane protein YvbJ